MINLRLWCGVLLILAQTPFAQGLSKKCRDELVAIPKSKANFDLASFSKDLVAEVVKVKAQMKLPFGKPADNKVTGIGITVGCLKAFPETPAQILTLLKEAGLDAAKNAAAGLGAKALAQGANALTPAAGLQQAGAGLQPQTAAAAPPKAPVLKECDVVFNPEKKFCYDGGVYDRCDGMPYNPTTHICAGDIANRATCGDVQYNPLIQKCENEAIFEICGEAQYNSKTHGCKDGEVFALSECNGVFYNPETHGCGENSVLLIKCGTLYYNSEKYGCENGVVLSKCGEAFYNHTTHGCGENNVILPKCGTISYNPATHQCKGSVVLRLQIEEEEKEEEKEEETYAESSAALWQGQAETEKPEEESEGKTFSFGFRTGLNFSYVYEEYKYGKSYNLDSKAGFFTGLVFDIAASSWFHFQPGIMYIQKGAEYRGPILLLDYIEFPILVSLKFSAVRLNAGPYLSLCIGSGYGGYGGSNYDIPGCNDYGISYGGGFDIGNFYIGLFYDYGLTDINNNSNYNTYNRILIGFSLGYNL